MFQVVVVTGVMSPQLYRSTIVKSLYQESYVRARIVEFTCLENQTNQWPVIPGKVVLPYMDNKGGLLKSSYF